MADLKCDVAIIGAGIAGASAAYEIAAAASVLLIEREPQPGYHATGRSAALYTENYGNEIIRALTIASRPFLERPPADFAEHPLVAPRGVLFVGRADQADLSAEGLTAARRLVPSIRGVSQREAVAMCPVLRADYVANAIWEADAMDIDVHGLHWGFLKGFTRRGGQVLSDHDVTALSRVGDGWLIQTPGAQIRARMVVNAAGAWADDIALKAGVAPIGIVPKRRTAITFDAPPGADMAAWPCVIDIAEEFYFKPDAGTLLASPADETPVPPCDVQPEEIDIALTVDRIERATTLDIRRIRNRWAGLRSFVADKSPVIGADGGKDGFFWLAAQGGYGIMTSPAAAKAIASLVLSGAFPKELQHFRLSATALSPDRLR